jgi:hypothetical protein
MVHVTILTNSGRSGEQGNVTSVGDGCGRTSLNAGTVDFALADLAERSLDRLDDVGPCLRIWTMKIVLIT